MKKTQHKAAANLSPPATDHEPALPAGWVNDLMDPLYAAVIRQVGEPNRVVCVGEKDRCRNYILSYASMASKLAWDVIEIVPIVWSVKA